VSASRPRSKVKSGEIMLKIIIALIMAFLIGAGCRWFHIPAPNPLSLVGAFLVVTMTLGFTITNYLLPPVATTEQTAQIARTEAPVPNQQVEQMAQVVTANR